MKISVKQIHNNVKIYLYFTRHNDYAMLQVDENVVTAWTPITEADGHLWIGETFFFVLNSVEKRERHS